jgi:hypothetical protein
MIFSNWCHMFARKQLAFAVSALLIATLISTSGCVGFTNWIMWGLYGQPIRAEYPDLVDQRVAIVCATKSSPFEPGSDTSAIARSISKILEREVKGIELIDAEEIADWIDQTNWSAMDYRELGRGLKADRVVAIEFSGLSFHDNPNEIRGRANFSVSVFEMDTGNRKHVDDETDFVFPQHGPAAVGEREFKKIYIKRLSEFIAELFYDHDFTEGFGNDALAQ